MSSLEGKGITAQQLHDMAYAVSERCPGATLVKNRVGDLSILDENGEYVGYLRLRFGEVGWLADIEPEDTETETP